MRDPYVYPGTSILRNVENIRDAGELLAFERIATANRLEMLPDTIPVTPDGYREIHRYIFQDIYDWAGEYRTVDIAKNNDYFCRAVHIARELALRLEAIRSDDELRGLDALEFSVVAAGHMAELNAIHPFRDGNGRTQRAFLALLGQRAGHSVDLARIDPTAWNDASRESFRTGDSRLIQELIARLIVQHQ